METRRRLGKRAGLFAAGLATAVAAAILAGCGQSTNVSPDAPKGDWHRLHFRLYLGGPAPDEGYSQRYLVRHTDLPVHVFVGEVELEFPDSFFALVPTDCVTALGEANVSRARFSERGAGNGRLEVDINLRAGQLCPAGDDDALVPVHGYHPLYWVPVTIVSWY